MTTVSQIKESINLEDLKNKDEFGLSDHNLINSEFYIILWEKIRNSCVKHDTSESRKGQTLSTSYYMTITNDELLNTLRQLYVNTKNSFVKKVVVSVGKSKKATEKQLEIIIEEMMKYNLTINF